MWMSDQKGLLSIFFVIVTVTLFVGAQGCVIYETPKTTITRRNTTVNFNCRVDAYGEDIYLIFNNQINSQYANKEDYAKKGIFWDCFGMRCELSVFASEENNGLLINCGFASCRTEDAFIIVVDGIPNPPEPPTVDIFNATFRNISWNPPWQYPVNGYTVMITNMKTHVTVLHTTSAHYILNRINNSKCEVLQFKVSADTEIGSTGFSNETIKGFPKALEYGNPLTAFALINTTVAISFHSRCTSTKLMFFKINERTVNVGNTEKEGMTWNALYCDDTNTKIGYNISIHATKGTNGTKIQCVFPQCNSETKQLIIVDNPPNAPDPPAITVLNQTSLNISWNPPWSHPVNQYIVYIHNLTGNGDVVHKHTTTKTFYVFNNQEGSGCDKLSYSVQAETDVGSTRISSETNHQFYKGVNLDQVEATKSYTFCKEMGKELTLHVSFQPSICSKESPLYHFELTNKRSNEVLTVTSEYMPEATFRLNEHALGTDLLTVKLSVSTAANQNLTMFNNISFYEVYLNDFARVISMEGTTGYNVTKTTCKPSYTLTKTGVAILSLFSLMNVSFCFICYFYNKCSGKRKVRSDERTQVFDLYVRPLSGLQDNTVDMTLESTQILNATASPNQVGMQYLKPMKK